MREIKFRAFSKKSKGMVFVEYATFLKDDSLVIYDDYKLMQYTGLKDSKGVEIYEGDIVDTGFNKAIIDYNEDTARFCFRRLQHRIKWIENITIINCYEVIGNIYENSELLND